MAQFGEIVNQQAAFCIEPKLSIGTLPTVHGIEETPQIIFRLEALFNVAASEVHLVCEVGKFLNDLFEREVCVVGWSVRGADGDNVGD